MFDTLAAISEILMHDWQLPAVKFFEPQPHFVAWMHDTFHSKTVYDVGAVVGHVARMLAGGGNMTVRALDTVARDKQEFPVIKADGWIFPFEAGSVVMLCRPCHGIFPEGVIKNAIRCKAGAILYVGLPKNAKDDLGKWRRHFKVARRLVGLNGESAYVWRMYANGV